LIGLLVALAVTGLADRVPLAFVRTGDDGLSQRFYHALDDALDASTELESARSDQAARYVLWAETNVIPIGHNSPYFEYKISLRQGPSIDSAVIARFDGRCMDTVAVCAKSVVARVASTIGS
jgi:hypothetical protein